MARTALVDSVVLIAAMHGRDARHDEALRIVRAADAGRMPPLVLTDFILAETLNYLTRKGGSTVGREALRRIEASGGLKVARTPDAAYLVAKDDVYKHVDGLSFVDALTVAFMRHHGMKDLFSFDSGFDEVPGVRRLEGLPE